MAKPQLDIYTYKIARSTNGTWFGVSASRLVERIEFDAANEHSGILHHLERATANGEGIGPSVEGIQLMLEKLLAEGNHTIIVKETKRKLMDLITDFEESMKETP